MQNKIYKYKKKEKEHFYFRIGYLSFTATFRTVSYFCSGVEFLWAS